MDLKRENSHIKELLKDIRIIWWLRGFLIKKASTALKPFP
jgi:hypothetical protein